MDETTRHSYPFLYGRLSTAIDLFLVGAADQRFLARVFNECEAARSARADQDAAFATYAANIAAGAR